MTYVYIAALSSLVRAWVLLLLDTAVEKACRCALRGSSDGKLPFRCKRC
jgi:tRNA(Ile2) C34 agmatinyltransferase TiaS